MKKLLIILLAGGLAFSASAQKFVNRGSYYHPRSRVVISTGIYAPLHPYYGYGYYSYPFYPYPYYIERPTRLDLKIEDIRNDYRDRIWSARHDKTLPRKERRNMVHKLKHERDEAIIEAKRNYHKTK